MSTTTTPLVPAKVIEGATPDRHAHDWEAVFQGENDYFDGGEREAGKINVAFSGGGIRSATFNLGVLQFLARRDVQKHNLLDQVRYISSVSGGSYINAWFSKWVRQTNYAEVKDALSSDEFNPNQRGR